MESVGSFINIPLVLDETSKRRISRLGLYESIQTPHNECGEEWFWMSNISHPAERKNSPAFSWGFERAIYFFVNVHLLL